MFPASRSTIVMSELGEKVIATGRIGEDRVFVVRNIGMVIEIIVVTSGGKCEALFQPDLALLSL